MLWFVDYDGKELLPAVKSFIVEAPHGQPSFRLCERFIDFFFKKLFETSGVNIIKLFTAVSYEF